MKARKQKRSQFFDLLERLETKVDALQAELERARAERSILRSQLDRTLYLLERFDPDAWQQLVAQFSEDLQARAYFASEVGADYLPLAHLLAAERWREADEETWLCLLRVRDRESEGWLRPEDWLSFPQTDLQTLDRLWFDYSSHRFGPIVQAEIWAEVAGDYGAFCDRVGWRAAGNWLYYDDLAFRADAPAGHLPVLGWRKRACYGTGSTAAAENLAYLSARLFEAGREEADT